MKYSCHGCAYTPYASKDKERCRNCQSCTPLGVVCMNKWAPAAQTPEEDEPSKETLTSALDMMAEYLGECAECPAAETGLSLWPECNGESEACGDNRTVGGCWKQYFLEKARAQKNGQDKAIAGTP